MLYDEEGKAYIEPPLLPEDLHLRYIVLDYGRMMLDYEKKVESHRRLKRRYKELLGLQYAYYRIIQQQHAQICKLMKLMKGKNISVPGDIRTYHEQIKKMFCYYNQIKKNQSNEANHAELRNQD